MSNFDQEQNFEPDLGDAQPLTSGPQRGLRAKAERAFIQMVQAAFLGNDEFPYHPDENQGRLFVRSAVSKENQAFLPRVEVKIGPLSEYEGSIDNLNKWSKPVQRHLYVDQAQVVFICTAEEEAESSDLGERVRRVLDMARKDLGKRGLFAMQASELTAPQSARPGTEEDDVYQSVVKSPFMIVERQERKEDPSAPFGSGVDGIHQYISDAQDEDLEGDHIQDFREEEIEGKTVKEIEVESAIAHDASSGTKIVLTFERELDTHQVAGITVALGPETVSPYAVRNNQDYNEICLETDRSVSAGTPITVSYDPGNLRDYEGHPVPEFGPIDVDWA
jgi:hypothetical protein